MISNVIINEKLRNEYLPFVRRRITSLPFPDQLMPGLFRTFP